jgi:hypothetical protein
LGGEGGDNRHIFCSNNLYDKGLRTKLNGYRLYNWGVERKKEGERKK